jgi:hypothetical protein
MSHFNTFFHIGASHKMPRTKAEVFKMTYETFMIKEQFLICTATYHSMYYDEYKFTIPACFQNIISEK